MDHTSNEFQSCEELAEILSRNGVHREYRARLALEYGSDEIKIELLKEIVKELRKPWRHQGQETEWRGELVLENAEFCDSHNILALKAKKIPVPKVTKEESEVLNPQESSEVIDKVGIKSKKPKKPAAK